jgi:hypothetical protein
MAYDLTVPATLVKGDDSRVAETTSDLVRLQFDGWRREDRSPRRRAEPKAKSAEKTPSTPAS